MLVTVKPCSTSGDHAPGRGEELGRDLPPAWRHGVADDGAATHCQLPVLTDPWARGGGCPGNLVRLSRDVECSLSVEWPGARARLYIGGGRSGRRPCDIESFIALWGWIPILSRWICISSLGYAFLHLSFECSALVTENLFLWHPAITKCASIQVTEN